MFYPVSDPGSQLFNGKFADGDESQGTDPSLDKAAHMNAVYDELIHFIESAGLTPNETDKTQIAQAANIFAPWQQIIFVYVNLSLPNPVPGWLLCDGTNGTPDLLDRFVVSAGQSYPVGFTGGANTQTITIGSTTITISQMPSHGHQLLGQLLRSSTGDSEGSSGRYNRSGTDDTSVQPTGGSQSHTHTATGIDNRPPFFALAPFMRADYAQYLIDTPSAQP